VFERSGRLEGVCPALTSEPLATRDDLLALAETAFGFLDPSEPHAKKKIDKSDMTTLAYPLGETFVELELDWRERAAFVLVGWCRNGRIPEGYYTDSHGTVVRHSLAAVLNRGNATDRAAADRLRKAIKASGAEAMARQIRAYAEVLRVTYARLPELLSNLPPTH
jgi:hypothetical protein